MTVHTVFCSANDRNVSLIARTSDWTWRALISRDATVDIACLERGVRCTGTFCPLYAAAPDRGDREEARRAGALPAN